jgi:DNA polymerase/3'-5' exonuclease PolX
MKIHGVGPSTARDWYYRGYRTLSDLLQDPHNVLQDIQKIALRYFHDLQERIPREEVKEISDQVLSLAKEVDPGIQGECLGSYRRGKLTCGDIDMILYVSGGKSITF